MLILLQLEHKLEIAKILINNLDLPAVLGLTADNINGRLLLPPDQLIEHRVETPHETVQIGLVVLFAVGPWVQSAHLAAFAGQLD
jgi:hypothetical protein